MNPKLESVAVPSGILAWIDNILAPFIAKFGSAVNWAALTATLESAVAAGDNIEGYLQALKDAAPKILPNNPKAVEAFQVMLEVAMIAFGLAGSPKPAVG